MDLNNQKPIVIAIDGPSGSGKSSTARALAARANFQYLDTGALYRAITLLAISKLELKPNQDLNSFQVKRLMELLAETKIEFNCNCEHPGIFINGQEVNNQIRSAQVNSFVSYISKISAIRVYLKKIQQEIISSAKSGIVVEGRDIGTVIAPDADLKIFLVADLDVRTIRRVEENKSQSIDGADRPDLEVEQNLEIRDQIDSSREISPLSQSPDAELIDTTYLELGEVVDEIWNLLIAKSLIGFPTVGIVGRPNIGKSTLVNRLLGRNEAIVEDMPGVTRDRVRYEATWNGKRFFLVDTGGWQEKIENKKDSTQENISVEMKIENEVNSSIWEACENSDLILFVVDSQVGTQQEDLAMLSRLRKLNKQTILVANKVDSQNDELQAHALWNLGAGEPHMISALHGRGAGELLDLIVNILPEFGSYREDPNLYSIALVGKPNVGKSSLLNILSGSSRAIVSEKAGTTRDPIDEIVQINGESWKLIDTAGLRKKSDTASGTDYYAALRTVRALERAHAALVVLDGSQTLTEQDLRILSLASQSGKALILVINKWDLVDEDRRIELERELDRQLVQFTWVERVNLSAKTGWHKDKLAPTVKRAITNWKKRVPTSTLNSYIGNIVAATPPPVRGGKQPKIKFVTQVSICPPKFVLFTTDFLEEGYRRFLERMLREKFDFSGTPIEVVAKIKNSRE